METFILGTMTSNLSIFRISFFNFRLPNESVDFHQRFQILLVDGPLDGLPTAQTCFFQLRLPPYTSKNAMAKKMLYAIKHCRCIDMDNYMLARNTNTVNN